MSVKQVFYTSLFHLISANLQTSAGGLRYNPIMVAQQPLSFSHGLVTSSASLMATTVDSMYPCAHFMGRICYLYSYQFCLLVNCYIAT